MSGPEYTLVVESFTLDEGGDFGRFKKALSIALELARDDGGEVIVVDVCSLPELRLALRDEFPQARVIDAVGLGYDDGKMKAAAAARGRFVLFLDGDCLPRPGWKDEMLAALRQGRHAGFGGFTRYDGGFWAELQSVMDFGFLYPCVARPLQCYAFNNSAFVRAELLAVPAGGRKLRCACFHHAQRFLRRGTPLMLVPAARVLHESQPLIRERTRQGYDLVAACWEDPELKEARLARLGILSVPLFYGLSVLLDWRRALVARSVLGQSAARWASMLPCFPLLRLLDAAGMLQAFFLSRPDGGWGGNRLRRRSWRSGLSPAGPAAGRSS